MYNDVVAPECFLPRNIRENFAMDLRETFLRLSERLKIKKNRRFALIVQGPSV